jgi:hypothetical protein
MRAIFLLLFVINTSVAQKLTVVGSLDEAKKKSKNLNSLILILINQSDCDGCKKIDVIKRLSSKTLQSKFKDFIIYPINKLEGEGVELLKRYKLELRLPAYIFVDSTHELIHNFSGFSERDAFYLNIHKNATDRTYSQKSYSYYLKEYSKRKTDNGFLREYLEYLNSKNQVIQDSVFETYLTSLAPHQEGSLETKIFVLTKGPVYKGSVYTKIDNMKGGVAEVYRALSYAEKATMNTKIIRSTIQQAISAKDSSIAIRGASFAKNTWLPQNPRRGQLSYLSNLRTFYLGIKDTTNYLLFLSRIVEEHMVPDVYDSLGTIIKDQKLAMELNNTAYTIYKWTRETEYLEKGLRWVQIAIEAGGESPENLDTMAHLYFRLGDTKLAIDVQKRAVNLAKSLNRNEATFKLELEKMKSGNL